MKKVKNYLTVASLLLGLNLFAQGLGFTNVNTQSDLNSVMKQAEKQNKIVLIDFTADWCVWCVRMDENTFSTTEAGDLKNKIMAVRISDEAEVYSEISDKYGIEAFPTIIYLASDGLIIKKEEGYIELDPFIELSKDCIASMEGYQEAKAAYSKNPSDLLAVAKYLSFKSKLENPNLDEEMLNKYYSNIRLNYNNAEQWSIIAASDKGLDLEHVKYVVDHVTNYYLTVGEDELRAYMIDVYSENYETAVYTEDRDLLARCFALLRDVGGVVFPEVEIEALIEEQNISYYEYLENWDAYAKESLSFIKKSKDMNAENYLEYYVNFFMYVEDDSLLSEADNLAEGMFEMSNDFYSHVVYALTRYKCNDEIRAKRLLDNAFELAETSDEEEVVSIILASMDF